MPEKGQKARRLMPVMIREMTPADIDSALRIWQITEGVGLSAADSVDEITRFLVRNPGLSFVAMEETNMVGAVLCGHDGRRGYLHHLVVAESHRRAGIGRELVSRCLNALRINGIMKCHLFIFVDNDAGMRFWRGIGWTHRQELAMMSAWTSPDG
jgi:ribosomal protein S18 acetylase RimI-like enzyme